MTASPRRLTDSRLCLYLPSLAGGGAERLYLNLAPYFLKAGLKVGVLLDSREGELLSAVPEGVDVDDLGATRVRHAIPRLVKRLNSNPPELILSSISINNVALLVADFFARGPASLIITQHNTLSREATRGGIYRILPIASRLLIRRAAAVAAVSSGVAADFTASTGLPRDRIEVIPNGVITEDFERRAALPCPHRWLAAGEDPVFLGVGRLTPQKDFPTLLRAFATFRRSRPGKLIILGEGPLRSELESLARGLDIGGDVDMPGYIANPLPFIRAASALVMSSAYEGFGLVLAEALALGTQVVSTDCEHGPSEILDRGRFGRLVKVGDDTAMAAAMRAALDERISAEELKARGRDFSLAACAGRYLALFERLLGERG